jgi:glycosyltransferase involved in cell wall biosynthesis
VTDQRRHSISVIIPVYNGARFLPATIRSVCVQTHLPAEIIIIDDSSSDDSPAIIQRAAAGTVTPIRYVSQANQGPGAARNHGVALAKGELLAFLDQDDLWHPEKLARQHALLAQSPSPGYTITQVEYFLESGDAPPSWLKPEVLLSPQPGYIPSCLLVQRALWADVGPFDPALLAGSDMDWFVRAQEAFGPPALVPEVLVRHRVHDNNQSGQLQTVKHDLLALTRKALQRKRNQSNLAYTP